MRSLAALALGLCLTGVAGAQEAPLSATVEVPLEAWAMSRNVFRK